VHLGRVRKVVGVAVGVGVVVAVGAVLVLRADDDRVWKIETRSGPDRLVADDATVCGSDHQQVVCLDAATGDELFRTPSTHLAAVLSMSEGTLLAGDVPEDPKEDTNLRAYTRDGRELWRISGNYAYDRPIPVVDGVAIVPESRVRSIQGLDLSTGEPVWETPYPAPQADVDYEGPLLSGSTFTDGENVYATLVGPERQLVALDAATGTELWKTTVDEFASASHVHQLHGIGGTDSIAAVVGPLVGEQRLLVIDRASGDVSAEVSLGERPAALATVDGTIVVLTGEELRGYSPDGDELWTQTVEVSEMTADQETVLYSGRLLVVDDTLYLDTTGVWTIDPATGERTGTVVDEGVGPFVATSELIVIGDGCCPVPGYVEARRVGG